MSLWEMRAQEKGLIGHVPNPALSGNLSIAGVDPIAIRHVLETSNVDLVELDIAKPSAAKAEMSWPEHAPDLLFWFWVGIFSDRAVKTAVELGCDSVEFWPCRFRPNPDERYFLHLPLRTFDIVDLDRSTFLQILPVDPPLPMFIDHLVAKELPETVPPIFRADVRKNHVFSEVFVRDDFRLAWQQMDLRGARFRQLTE